MNPLCDGETFVIDESWLKACPPQVPKRTGSQVTTLAQGEKALIEAALIETHGRISGPKGAAAKLGIPRQTLESKIKARHIDKLSVKNADRSAIRRAVGIIAQAISRN